MSIFACAHRLRAPSLHSSPEIARRAFAALALIAAIAAPRCVFSQSTLTLIEAQRIAVERSRLLAGQDASIIAAREMAVAAGQLPDPVLRLGIDNLPVDGADRFSVERDFMTMRRIGVTQEFTRDDKRRLRAARYEREADRAAAEKAAGIAAVQRDTAMAWLDRYHLERMRAAVADQGEEAKLEVEAAEAAYRAGRGAQADIFMVRAARVALDGRLSELDRRIRNARAMLARWVGSAADAPLAGTPAIKTVRLDARTLDQDLERHPEIALLGRQVAVAESEAQLARANQRSDWSVELAYQQRGSAFSNMISVGVSIPLQWDRKNRQGRELAAKLALTERAKAQQEDALRAHIAEVRTLLNEWENGHERLSRYERQLISLARDRTQAALAAYRAGKGELNAVLAARRNEIEVRIQTVQLEMDTARVWAQLNFLVPDGAHGSHTDAGATSMGAK